MKKAKRAKKTVRKVRKVTRKRSKPIPRKRTPRQFFNKNDPFHLNPELIPAGWSYQWSPGLDPKSGWRPVPYSRHAHDFPREAQNASGFIVIEGLWLTEIPKEHVASELLLNAQKARNMNAEFDRSLGREHGGKGFWIMPEGWLASYSKEEIRALDAPGEASEPVEVAVTLLMKVPGRWNDAAAYLKLNLSEYTRRRILMTRPVLGCLDPFSDEPLYEAVTLSISPTKEI